MIRLALAALVAALPAVASAHDLPCVATHIEMMAVVAERYGETRQSIGITPGAQVVEVFASIETGTWTVIITMPNGGPTCFLVSGDRYTAIPPGSLN